MIRDRRAALAVGLLLSIAATTALVLAQAPEPQAPPRGPRISQALRERIERGERVRAIVELNLPSDPFVPEAALPDADRIVRQRGAIAAQAARILARLSSASILHRYLTVPQIAIEIGPSEFASLEAAGSDVVGVAEDEILHPVLADSVPLIGADQVWAAGYDGSGTMIAILDTGVDGTHPFLAGKVVEEACYSSTVAGTSQSLCPNGATEQVGPGAAVPCALSTCFHGTHVAGIAAGNGDNAGQTFSGVAKGAELMAVQVFSEIINSDSCGGAAPCIGAFTSDIVAGLEHVYAEAWTHNLVAVNMSLGGTTFPAPCDSDPTKPIIDNLRAVGIATTVAAGNAGATSGISTPACVSSAISVGSTDKQDVVSWFSNVAPFMSIFAPGESITSSVPGGGYMAASGTSMAAPHVAGTWALLREAAPNAGVSLILQALQQTGLPITDTRPNGIATIPRERAFAALMALVPVTHPLPAITSLTPNRARAGTGAFTLAIAGSGFDGLSVAEWNGTPRPTTVVSTTQMLVSIPASDLLLPNGGVAQVSVFAPAPGGGTSASVALDIDPPSTLSVSASTVAPGSAVTVTLANGRGGATDWLALANVAAPNANYLQWTYVGAGVINRTWTVNVPTSGGPFEFRLFLNDGHTLAATSPPIAIDSSINALPVVTALAPPNAIVGSGGFTLTVSGTGFVATSVVRWNGANRPTTFVTGNQLRASIDASDLTAVGTAPVTVFTPAPGGGTSASVPFVINQTPTLGVSTTAADSGSSVTVTLTNGAGGANDWLALAPVASPNESKVQWTYVGAGVTTRTWMVSMPASGGPFEFRLFLNNGYTRAATSPAISLNPGAATLTSLSPASGPAGGAGFTLTVNGSGFVPRSVVRWNGADRPTTFVSSQQLQAAIGAGDIAATASVPVTVFTSAPGGGVSGSLLFAIGPSPSLAVSATSVAGGASVTATLTGAPGGATDWLAFAATGSANTTYLQWIYVGAGVTTRTWTINVPTTGGPFEFRLFLNNSYTRAATSAPVSLSGPVPSLDVSTTSAAGGTSVTATLTNGIGGAKDWLALAASSASNATYVQWIYVGAGVTSRTWTITLPSSGGPYEFRLFLNDGYTRAATSPAITLTP